MKSIAAAVAASFVLAGSGTAANAQISDDVVKIGVLTDMSSLYADATGKGSLAAVQMAVADYGGKVKGKPVEVIFAEHGSLDLRHLRAVQRSRPGDGQARRGYMVLRHGGLRVLHGARTRCCERRQGERRQGAWKRPPSAQFV